jgi:hypothetical protein
MLEGTKMSLDEAVLLALEEKFPENSAIPSPVS